jgi:hypothetical protein
MQREAEMGKMTSEQYLFLQGRIKRAAWTTIYWACFIFIIPGIIFGFWPLLIIALIVGFVIGVCGESQIAGSGIKEAKKGFWKSWGALIICGAISTIGLLIVVILYNS